MIPVFEKKDFKFFLPYLFKSNREKCKINLVFYLLSLWLLLKIITVKFTFLFVVHLNMKCIKNFSVTM